MSNSRLDEIRYISLPKSMERKIGDFQIRSDIQLPVQVVGKQKITPENVTMEAIVAGMLTIIAYDPNNKYFDYYRAFVFAVQGNCVQELNTAAIAKEKQKDYPFAEELFLDVYHLMPQAASCINLAAFYSAWSQYCKKDKDEKGEDFYLNKALTTLEEGLEKFGEDENILAELGSLNTYLGNLDEAEGFLSRYLAVATEGEKKQKLKKMYKDVKMQLDSDLEIKQAYDFMMLDEEDKALTVIEKFIEKNPKLWHGHFIKGWALRKLKNYVEAEKALLKCLELGESNPDIYNELSICSLENGNRDLAKNYLDIAVDMDPDNFTLISNLAFLHLQDEEFDEAKEWLEKARLIAPEDRQLKYMMEEYTSKTGETFGDLIQEEIVHNLTKDNADKYSVKDLNEEHECHCHDDEHECHCHDDEHECHCHDDEHECHCHDDEHECHCHDKEE